MPIFCWTALASNLLIVAAFPILTATFAMLLLDRYGGFHFFTNELGGNPMMYINLIWCWGHPEVYILILPAFGVFSEVVATFSGKPLFGYRSMVMATMAICVLSFMVWLHHFFTMGAGADVNAFFGIMTMIIAVPTGVKIFNWLFTLYGGRIRFTVPIYWAIGLHGDLRHRRHDRRAAWRSRPPTSCCTTACFLIAHFHNVTIGGVVFGAMAGTPIGFPSLRLYARRAPGQGGVLVLVHRLLSCLHAALRAGAHGRDAAHAALREYAWQPLMLVALGGRNH